MSQVISLSKGANISLTKEAPGLKKAHVGLGWSARATEGVPFDLDVSIFMLGADGKSLSDKHFIFYNNKVSPCGTVVHQGDNRTGDGDGDDEVVIVDLPNVPAQVQKLVIAVTIDEAIARKQTFGQVSDAYVRVIDSEHADNGQGVRFDLTEDSSTETAMIFGELYRHNGEWKFRAIGQGYAGGLSAVAAAYGLNAA